MMELMVYTISAFPDLKNPRLMSNQDGKYLRVFTKMIMCSKGVSKGEMYFWLKCYV